MPSSARLIGPFTLTGHSDGRRRVWLDCKESLWMWRPVWQVNYRKEILLKRQSEDCGLPLEDRSEEHTSELQSLMRISYAVFCLKKKTDHRKSVNNALDNTLQHININNHITTVYHYITINTNQ